MISYLKNPNFWIGVSVLVKNQVLQFLQSQFLQFFKVSNTYFGPNRYLLIQSQKQYTRTKCEICSKLIIKTPERHFIDLKKTDELKLRN